MALTVTVTGSRLGTKRHMGHIYMYIYIYIYICIYIERERERERGGL